MLIVKFVSSIRISDRNLIRLQILLLVFLLHVKNYETEKALELYIISTIYLVFFFLVSYLESR